MKVRTSIPALALIALLLLSLSCSLAGQQGIPTTGDEVRASSTPLAGVSPAPPISPPTEASPVPSIEVQQTAEQTLPPPDATQPEPVASGSPTATVAQPTEQPTPTQTLTVTPEAEALRLIAFGYGPAERQMVYGFVVENPNQRLGIESSEYEVTAYDPGGTVLETGLGYLPLLFPGQKMGASGTLPLLEGKTIARLEIQIRTGKAFPWAQAAGQPLFAVQTRYYPSPYNARAAGIVLNTMDKDITDVQVAAIAFDHQDRVVGGGYGFLSFAPAYGQSPVSVGLIVSGQPAKVEIFPGASGLWSIREASTVAPALKLIRSGFSQDRQQAHYAFFVENPNQQAAVQSVRFQAAAYDAEGNPLEAASGNIPLLLPGERLGVSGCLFLPENSLASRIEVQLLPGEYTSLQKLSNPPLSTVQISYGDSSGTGKTIGIIRNTLNRAVSNVQVYAVAYDVNGNLIGGGSSFLNSIDGNSDATVEIAISCAGTPARVELYPAMTDLAAILR